LAEQRGRKGRSWGVSFNRVEGLFRLREAELGQKKRKKVEPPSLQLSNDTNIFLRGERGKQRKQSSFIHSFIHSFIRHERRF